MVLKASVSLFHEGTDIKARDPPENMLNALHRRFPRSAAAFILTRTYKEPLVPIFENTATSHTLGELGTIHNATDVALKVLDAELYSKT